jgi:hypothetical protein
MAAEVATEQWCRELPPPSPLLFRRQGGEGRAGRARKDASHTRTWDSGIGRRWDSILRPQEEAGSELNLDAGQPAPAAQACQSTQRRGRGLGATCLLAFALRASQLL